jgi:hypothetical protein
VPTVQCRSDFQRRPLQYYSLPHSVNRVHRAPPNAGLAMHQLRIGVLPKRYKKITSRLNADSLPAADDDSEFAVARDTSKSLLLVGKNGRVSPIGRIHGAPLGRRTCQEGSVGGFPVIGRLLCSKSETFSRMRTVCLSQVGERLGEPALNKPTAQMPGESWEVGQRKTGIEQTYVPMRVSRSIYVMPRKGFSTLHSYPRKSYSNSRR